MPPFLGQQIVNRGAAQFVVSRTDYSRGFVERDVNLAPGPKRLSIDRHLIVGRIDARSQFTHRFSVHLHSTCEDDLFAGPTRCDTGVSQEFLKTNHESGK